MSERILKALLRLFAIVARTNDDDNELEGRGSGIAIVQAFLKERLPQRLVDEYLLLFHDYLNTFQKPGKKGKAKRLSLNSVKILTICIEINKELSHGQKIIVLSRLIEFIYVHPDVSDQEIEFVTTVAETFNVDREEYSLMQSFLTDDQAFLRQNADTLFITPYAEDKEWYERHLELDGLDGKLILVRIESANLYLLRYEGSSTMQLNGQGLINGRTYLFNQGASVRSSKTPPLYYSDIISAFLSDEQDNRITFKAKEITYKFKRGNIGLHELSLIEESGKLIGIMGASGSGKSTLLNILNGNLAPTTGSVSINGCNIHTSPEMVEGLIGYVAQDDLLIEELTVFQNLFYNAKLCFGDKTDEAVTQLVYKMLLTLGLADTAHLKVGNPLEKTISGGQRKRLNIALELIREPAILFVDEPTSGLSSRDSENIMDLLKELALKGKLIFVVIHQPSSDIFKMFDKLVMLDVGGYPIYYGNPVDSIIYFKKLVEHINSNESECPHCGNVNPEQIFNITEAKVVDEYGNATESRKVSAKEWYEYYQSIIGKKILDIPDEEELPRSQFNIPNKLKQFRVFITRDVLSKLANTQYIAINLLEAPALALLLSFFMRFFLPTEGSTGYNFRENDNIPAFIFISVIVSLFIGLTVSSEEIIRDRKIRKRETFLNLSKNSYFFSKIAIMFSLSAIQMFLYVMIGNHVLGIRGMSLVYWLILFSTSCFANMLGLNISASFNSAKVIYILIPILIIPQMLFSGIIVKFDKLNPMFASQSGVPWIGNIMASRWAYEAIAVAQFKWNDYEKNFYELEKQEKFSNWKKDYWIPALKNEISEIKRYRTQNADTSKYANALLILRNEIKKENKFLVGLDFKYVQDLTAKRINDKVFNALDEYLMMVNEHYKQVYLRAEKKKEDKVDSMTNTPEKNAQYLALMNNYNNENLDRFANNRNDLNFIVEYNGQLIQKKDLIYLDPYFSGFFGAHFYSPTKSFFGSFIDTFYANLIVIWGMTLLLAIALFTDAFKCVLNKLEQLAERFSLKRAKPHTPSIGS